MGGILMTQAGDSVARQRFRAGSEFGRLLFNISAFVLDTGQVGCVAG
jgi:hypothetical protein